MRGCHENSFFAEHVLDQVNLSDSYPPVAVLPGVGPKTDARSFLKTGRLKFTQAGGRMFQTNVGAEFARIQLFEQEA